MELNNIHVAPGCNSLWPCNAISHQRSGSTLVQVMCSCLTASSHYLYQCWLITIEFLWLSPEGNFTGNAEDIYPWYGFENNQFKITAASLRANLLTSSLWWCLATSSILVNTALELTDFARSRLPFHSNGLVQERRHSSALAMELHLFCTNPSNQCLSCTNPSI